MTNNEQTNGQKNKSRLVEIWSAIGLLLLSTYRHTLSADTSLFLHPWPSILLHVDTVRTFSAVGPCAGLAAFTPHASSSDPARVLVDFAGRLWSVRGGVRSRFHFFLKSGEKT